MVEKKVKVTNKGMITIPASMRKKYGINDGDYVIVEESDEREIKIRKIESVKSLRERALSVEEFKEVFQKSRKEDLELER